MKRGFFMLAALSVLAFPFLGKAALLEGSSKVAGASVFLGDQTLWLSQAEENGNDPATDDGEDLRDGDSDSNSNDDSDKDDG